MADLKDELSQMYKSVNGAKDEEKEEDLGNTPTDENKEELEDVEEETSETQKGKEGLQVEEEEPPSEEEVEDPNAQFKELLERYNEQSKQLLELQERVGSPQSKEEPKPAPTPTPTPTVPKAPVAFDMNTIKPLLEQALIEDNVEPFLQAMAKVVEHVTSNIPDVAALKESMLLEVAPMATRVAKEQYTLIRAVDTFYTDNPDLRPYMPIVGTITSQVASEHPEFSLGQVLEETEKRSRAQLRLKKTIVSNSGDPKNIPFAKRSNPRKPGPPEIPEAQKEFLEMIKASKTK